MNEITTTNKLQVELEERQDVNSKRAYLNRTTDFTGSVGKSEDTGKLAII